MNWAVKRDMAYKVIVWSKSDQRITDKLKAPSFAVGQQMLAQIRMEDPDLDGWVCSYFRKTKEEIT
jgi:hypothetical protein